MAPRFFSIHSLIFCSTSTALSWMGQPWTKYYVDASSLIVRERPDVRARMVTLLPYGTPVEGRPTNVRSNIAEKEAEWIVLRHGGFVFGGYLVGTPRPSNWDKALKLMRHAANVRCMSDTSRFIEETLVLSSGRVRYHMRDSSPCTTPNQELHAEGIYAFDGTTLQIDIASGQIETSYEACGMRFEPSKYAASNPRRISLSWHSSFEAFLTAEMAVTAAAPELAFNKKLCAFQSKGLPEAAKFYELCSEDLREFDLSGLYCPGVRTPF